MKVRSSCPPVCARPARPLRCFVRCRGTAHHLRQVRHISWLLSRERSGFPSENDQLTSRKAAHHDWRFATTEQGSRAEWHDVQHNGAGLFPRVCCSFVFCWSRATGGVTSKEKRSSAASEIPRFPGFPSKSKKINGAPLRARATSIFLPCERGLNSHTGVITRPHLSLAL